MNRQFRKVVVPPVLKVLLRIDIFAFCKLLKISKQEAISLIDSFASEYGIEYELLFEPVEYIKSASFYKIPRGLCVNSDFGNVKNCDRQKPWVPRCIGKVSPRSKQYFKR